MPVPAQRDPDLTRDILAKWLGDPARLPGARITDLQTPEFSGFSSETLMVDVECGDAAAARSPASTGCGSPSRSASVTRSASTVGLVGINRQNTRAG